jgi:Flp pilus assembly protein TadG
VLRYLSALSRHLVRDRNGNVAIIFALVLIPIIGVVSLAIDYGRALKTKSLISNAADAALNEIAGMASAERAELERRVRVSLDANLPEDMRGLPFTLRISEQAKTVQLEAATAVPTAIMSLIGVDRMDVVVNSTVKWQEPTPTLDAGPMLAGRPESGDAQRAAEQIARELGQQIGRGGAGGEAGAGAAGMEALSPGDVAAARQALSNPEIQRMSEDLKAQLRDAIANARRR